MVGECSYLNLLPECQLTSFYDFLPEINLLCQQTHCPYSALYDFTVTIDCYHIKRYKELNVEIIFNHIHSLLKLNDWRLGNVLSYKLIGDDVLHYVKILSGIDPSQTSVAKKKYWHIICCVLRVLLKRV